MDIRSRWMSSLWKLLLLLSIINIGSGCPTPCICTMLPDNKKLSNLLLRTHSRNANGMESVSCINQSLTDLPLGLPMEVIYLDVSYNQLVTIGNEYQNLTHLKTIDFSNNKFNSLDNEQFYNLNTLQKLILKENGMTKILSNTFQSLSDLANLDLSKNQLISLNDEMFSGLENLKALNLSRNRITKIKGLTFTKLKNLHILDLSFNSLERLHHYMFDGMHELKILNLSHNFITYISAHVFRSLKKLEVLDLSHNVLRSTSDFMFNGIYALQYLDISNNFLEYISDLTFNNATNLRTLHLDNNSIPQFNIPLFTHLRMLEILTLTHQPYLTNLVYNTFTGLDNLKHLNLSLNPRLSFVNPHLFSTLPRLQDLDLHRNNISYLSALTFHFNLNLTHVDLSQNPFLCNCDIAWLAKMLRQNSSVYGNGTLTCAINDEDIIPISAVTNDTFPCAKVTQNITQSRHSYFKLGSAARIECTVALDPTMFIIWTTPRKKTLIYHAFHPEATRHHPDPDYVYTKRDWINSTSYHSEMFYRKDRVILLSDGSLLIDYVLRSDTGPYTCEVKNAYHNATQKIFLWLDQSCLYDVQIWSLVIGVCCATSFFILILIYTVIRQCTIRVINKRRRDAIRQFLENVDIYKQNQITRIRENYSNQLTRVSEHYHNQLERLRGNYTMQMGRVKRGCSHQVDKIRDNYGTQKCRLKDYSSHQIEQIRTAYNNQLLRIRDYGLLQFDRLRETCKLQQQNVLKILETMNIDNCKSVIETECMRTESMIFETPFVNDDDIQGLSLIGSESDYMTASDDSKSNESPTPEVETGSPRDISLDVEEVFDPLIFAEVDLYCDNDIEQEQEVVSDIPDIDLGDISLHTIT
ncbi:hypothetical protein SNE40_016143 [Patella caerulea]|uniref:Ig-like domain-containing protein n=1 Tax=Patella caerulea TaxID=87958 RepID=A0AAN8J8S2_PATCE